MLKRILFGMSCWMLATVLHAAVYKPYEHTCQGDSVYVPCEPKAWDAAVDLLILNEWAGEASFLRATSPAVSAGFRVEGSYHYTPANELRVSWAYYNARTGLGATLFDNALSVLQDGTVSYLSHFDIINLEFTQKVNIGERWDWKAFGGLEYVYLSDKLHAPRFLFNANQATNWVSKLNGIGPRGGSYAAFYLDEGLSIFGMGAVSVLSSRDVVNVSGGVLLTGVTPNDQGTRSVMVTQMDIQLGIIIEKLIAQGQLTFRGGFETHNFNNASAGFENIGWQGGFLGFKWLGLA